MNDEINAANKKFVALCNRLNLNPVIIDRINMDCIWPDTIEIKITIRDPFALFDLYNMIKGDFTVGGG